MKEKEIIILDDLYKILLNDINPGISDKWMYIKYLEKNNWVNFIERHNEFSGYGEFQTLLIGLEEKEFVSLEFDKESEYLEFKNIRLKEKGKGNCEKRISNQILQYIYEFTIEGGCDKIKLVTSNKNEHWEKIYEKINVKTQYYFIFSELMVDLKKNRDWINFTSSFDPEDIKLGHAEFWDVYLTQSGIEKCNELKSENTNSEINQNGITKSKIQDLIAANKIDKAIEKLRVLTKNKEEEKEVILLSSRYFEIQEKKRSGTIDYDQISLRRSQIAKDLLDFVESNKTIFN